MVRQKVRVINDTDPFRDRPDLLTDPVFLVGNGKSREKFDLERLRNIGTIIGCNALYREFTPDLLIAIDQKMLRELKSSTYEGTVIMPRGRTVAVPKALVWKTEKFNTSGCYGLRLVSQKMGPKECYMLGMDGFPGNMYDGTLNYSTHTLQNFKGINSRYLLTLKEIKNTTFINVNDKDAWPKECHDTSSYRFMTYEDFEKQMLHWRNR